MPKKLKILIYSPNPPLWIEGHIKRKKQKQRILFRTISANGTNLHLPANWNLIENMKTVLVQRATKKQEIWQN